MKRDREPIAQGVAVHYQPQRHLLKDRIIPVTGASDGLVVKRPDLRAL